MRNVGIWGAGDLGELVAKQIKVYFKNWKIVSVMDTDLQLAGKKICNYTVCPPDEGMGKDRKIELLILCSNRYKEIVVQAALEYEFPEKQIIYVESIWPGGGTNGPQNQMGKTRF